MKRPTVEILVIGLGMACADKNADTGVEIDPGEPATFTEVRDEILLNSCAFSSCHGSQGAGDLTLTSEGAYDALVNVPSLGVPGETLVIPGNAADSYLMMKMAGADGITGDEMPPGSILDTDKLDAVRSWIDNGAQND